MVVVTSILGCAHLGLSYCPFMIVLYCFINIICRLRFLQIKSSLDLHDVSYVAGYTFCFCFEFSSAVLVLAVVR